MKTIRCWKKVSLRDLPSVAYELKECVDTPALILLSGPVGAGKTTFVQSFIKEGQGKALSPTYSLINEMGTILHADFYRLQTPGEITHLEIPLYLEGKDYFLVEWGEAYLPFLQKQVGDQFFPYQLTVEIFPSPENEECSLRNFVLSKVESETLLPRTSSNSNN